MKFCGKCGARQARGVLFCTNCGAAMIPPPPEPANSPRRKREHKVLIVGAVAYAAFWVLLFTAYFLVMFYSIRSAQTPEWPIPVPYISSEVEQPVQEFPSPPVIDEITPEPTVPVTPPDWTPETARVFMLYIVGSDLETELGAATMDIVEILDADTDFDNNRIVIMTGGALTWQNDLISADMTQIYEITYEDIFLVWEERNLDMADPGTLTGFLDFCAENYAAGEYNLIMWNHGAGPNFGFGYDEISGGILSMPMIVEALEDSVFGENNKLGFIGFDACLMGTVEIAYALSSYASYLISSQDIIPSWGWDYAFLSGITPEMTIEEIAVLIIDTYFDFCEEIFDWRPDFYMDITLSCLDLGNIGELEAQLNSLYARAGAALDAESFPSVAVVRDNVKEFGSVNPYFSYDLVDIGHLASLMQGEYPEETAQLLAALDNLVTYSRASIPNADGVSLYFPYSNNELLNELTEFYLEFNFAEDYTDFMHRFVELLQEPPEIEWNMARTPVVQESLTEYSMQLTNEQAETFASAAYYIIRYYTDDELEGYDGYYFVFHSSDVTLEDDNRLVAHYEGKTLMMYDPEDDSTFDVTMVQTELTDTYVRYVIPIMLQDLSGGLSDWVTRGAWIHVETDIDGSNPRVLAVLPELEDAENAHIASRELVDIYEYTAMQFFTFGRIVSANPDGSLKPFAEWESSGMYVGWEVNIDPIARNNLTLVQQEHDDDYEYYMLINIKDVYGNVVSSDMIPVS